MDVHSHPDGTVVVTARLPDGRVIRVCGREDDRKASRSTIESLLEAWVTWERRGRPT